MRAIAVRALETVIPSYFIDAGLLTDELESNKTGVDQGTLTGSSLPAAGLLDARILPERGYLENGTADADYTALQQVRGLTTQALGALAAYDTGAIKQGDPVALRSQLFALAGYTEILLADFFCSGVPLSTLDFQKDYTYHAGSTTDQVYQDALTKLDSAYALAQAADSVGLARLAQVLRGRAWLARGPQYYDSAAAAVAGVPDAFQYQLPVVVYAFASNELNTNWLNKSGTVSDREGETGLPYLSSANAGDPRVAVTMTHEAQCTSIGGCYTSFTIPTKYLGSLAGTGFMPFTLADGIEARLIEAEVALHTTPNAPTWLGLLNQLRATAPIPGTTAPNAEALPPLTDPGSSPNEQARVALLFQERAYWLFLTGHRQGDLRRLLRDYGSTQQEVYPTGNYLAPGARQYGTDVTAPIPGTEYLNPLFQGCLSRES
jgi:hypothetical protein